MAGRRIGNLRERSGRTIGTSVSWAIYNGLTVQAEQEKVSVSEIVRRILEEHAPTAKPQDAFSLPAFPMDVGLYPETLAFQHSANVKVALKRLAHEKRTTLAAVLREAVDDYIRENTL